MKSLRLTRFSHRNFYQFWLRFQYDQRAQDMVEYAMLSAFAATVVTAFFPQMISASINNILNEVRIYLNIAAGSRKSADYFN